MKSRALHPVLFAIFPVFFLFAQNATEMDISEVVRPLAITILAVIASLFILAPLVRQFERRALVVTIVVIFFFSYGHLLNFITDLTGLPGEGALDRNWICLAVWLPLVTGLILWAVRTGRDLSRTTFVLNTAGTILVVVQVVTASYTLVTRPDVMPDQSFEVSPPAGNAKTPDIYYIILDGYGRSDILRQMYDLDNAEFINGLQERDFFVADSASSNYCATLQSLTSALNLDYIHRIGRFNPNAFDRTPLARQLADNRMFAYLKKLGYTTATFETGHTPTSLKGADNYFEPPSALSEFDNVLLNSTPLPLLFSTEESQFDRHRRRISFTMNQLKRANQIKSPKVVFAHMISPHPPFVFESDGSPRERNWPFTFADGDHYSIQGGTIEEYKNGYRGQIEYISKEMQKVIDSIKANSSVPPIIIIQGDHGPGSGLFWQSVEKTDLRERFSILNAYYLPGIDDSVLSPSISPVNSFRIILNSYFGQNLELLPDRSYYTTRTRPYQFIDVTDRLKPPVDN